MTKRILILAALGAGLGTLPAPVHGESTVAYTDLSLDFDTATPTPLPGSNLLVELTVFNDGDFNAEEAVVSVSVPDGLTLISANPIGGSFDEQSGEWTTGEVATFAGKVLQLNFVVDVDGPPSIAIVADLLSFNSSFGSFDPDSTPGNADPCEDDYALLLLSVAGVPDAGMGAPDAGSCGGGPFVPADAGPGQAGGDAGDLDGGLGEGGNSGGGGCSVADGGAGNWPLLLLGLCILLWRRHGTTNPR